MLWMVDANGVLKCLHEMLLCVIVSGEAVGSEFAVSVLLGVQRCHLTCLRALCPPHHARCTAEVVRTRAALTASAPAARSSAFPTLPRSSMMSAAYVGMGRSPEASDKSEGRYTINNWDVICRGGHKLDMWSVWSFRSCRAFDVEPAALVNLPRGLQLFVRSTEFALTCVVGACVATAPPESRCVYVSGGTVARAQ